MRLRFILVACLSYALLCAPTAAAYSYAVSHITAGSPEWITFLQVDNHSSSQVNL